MLTIEALEAGLFKEELKMAPVESLEIRGNQ